MNIRHKLAEMNVVLDDTITKMVESKGLLPNAANNLKDWLEGGFLSEASLDSLRSLIESGNTEELNNRFYT
ncbi:MAG: hypothetical protein MK240_10385, partial [Opitutales bacterium]|nr:hypothetical protein [Opitutales bacterium]